MVAEPRQQKPWDWRAGMQFICGGSGAGLLLFTAVAGWQDPAWLTRGGYLALFFLAMGMLLVWLKLGRRWRAMFVILNPRTSWMSREALLALPLFLLAGIGIVFRLPPVAAFAALIGLAFLLAQANMLHAARGIPAWRISLIVPLIFVTGLVEGGALFAMVAAFFGGAGFWSPLALLILAIARLFVWRAYYRALSAPGGAPTGTVVALTAIRRRLVVAGHLLPLALLVIGLALGTVQPVIAQALIFLAALGALYGGWLMKFTIITRAAFTQGFALKRTPARTPGYAGPGSRPGWN